MCPACRQATAQCRCKSLSAKPVGDGVVRITRETKGRGGKAVTLVKGLPLDAVQLATLGKQLKAACGSGGTVKDGVIEIQGEHGERVLQVLQTMGYSAKRAGGGA